MISGTRQIWKSASGDEVEAFLRRVTKTPVRATSRRNCLTFAMDATASRKPTWERAARIQAAMSGESAELGGLETQLCYNSGVLGFGCSPRYKEANVLCACMTGVTRTAGLSQIGWVLRHVEESRRGKVNALVFVGDCVVENPDELAWLAGPPWPFRTACLRLPGRKTIPKWKKVFIGLCT